jgi:transcriptional regulator with XRE-family HTH domain
VPFRPALLGWSLAKLAAIASVTESSIDDFELERRAADSATVNALERAFAAVGVAFSLDDDGVRLLNPGEVNASG